MIISRGGGGGQVGILDTSKNNLKQFPYSDIQLSEKQQLGRSSRLLKYLEDRDTGWERNKLKTRETLARGVYGGGIHPCTQMEKKKNQVYIQLSEKQQLGLSRHFWKYSDIGWERVMVN